AGIASATGSVESGSTLWVDAVLEYGESSDALQTTTLSCKLAEAGATPTLLDLGVCFNDLDDALTVGWIATETWTTTYDDSRMDPRTYQAGDRLKLETIGSIETLA